ncbi:MAG TPA: glycoside hydrolase family 18 protein [Firmicutes bacterium]|nr:glycoside hydrolase family 18 protein [Bacillota bacterium]
MKRVVAYLASWPITEGRVSVQDINPQLLTHINYSFANLKPDGEIITDFGAPEEEIYRQLSCMRRENPHLRVLLSVGGWGWSGSFSDAAAYAESRERFAETALRFLLRWEFDGLDIDWEFPVAGGDGIRHRPEDRENFTRLLQAVRQKFDEQEQKDGKHYLLSMAAGIGKQAVQNLELTKIEPLLDFINVMTYDFAGSWSKQTAHPSPLYPEGPGQGCADSSIRLYLQGGIPAEKLNLGLNFSGRGWHKVPAGDRHGLHQPCAPGGWKGEPLGFCHITGTLIKQKNFVRYFDEQARVPYLYNGTDFISYEDEESIAEKVQYAQKMGLGGIMFWEFSGDRETVLQQRIAEILR